MLDVFDINSAGSVINENREPVWNLHFEIDWRIVVTQKVTIETGVQPGCTAFGIELENQTFLDEFAGVVVITN